MTVFGVNNWHHELQLLSQQTVWLYIYTLVTPQRCVAAFRGASNLNENLHSEMKLKVFGCSTFQPLPVNANVSYGSLSVSGARRQENGDLTESQRKKKKKIIL